MTVSVIIPALNEAGCIVDTVRSIRAQSPHEIIVVDGGSDDGTSELAAEADLVLTSPRGRANQMNLGAKHATGSTFLFLHADCTLQTGAIEAAERVLMRSSGKIVAGCFQMHVPEPGLLYRSIDGFATIRVRLTGLAYGDQGLFLRKDTFDRVGGFPPLHLMEDMFICKRLRDLGQILVLPHKIYVSARRWQRMGLIQQTLRNWTLTALTAMGVHPNRLAKFYPAVR